MRAVRLANPKTYHHQYGLSLTTFEHACALWAAASAAGNRTLSCTVRNTGGRAGDEVLQIFHRAKSIGPVDHPVPKRALIDFARLSVPRGGQAKVEFDIPTSKLMLVNAVGNLTLYSVRCSRLALGGVLF